MNLTPVDVMRLLRTHFSNGDLIAGEKSTFAYGGTGWYKGRGTYAGLASEVALLESPHANKRAAQLFPHALLAVMKGLTANPGVFNRMRMNKAVQAVMEEDGIGQGDIPAFYTNEAYYCALARALLARM